MSGERPSEEEILAKRASRQARKAAARVERDEVRKASLPEGVEFTAFPKIARLRRDVVITEKIDGTNAAVGITEDGLVYAQSRKRLITPDEDNHGFARWVEENADGLRAELGIGLHFGEWWGHGINRTYGQTEKIFSLFNVHRWSQCEPLQLCRVVPTLDIHVLSDYAVDNALDFLRTKGSVAAPGFANPEGIVVFHRAANILFKVTLEGDDHGKEYGA